MSRARSRPPTPSGLIVASPQTTAPHRHLEWGGIAAVTLDRNLTIEGHSDEAASLLSLSEADRGRPLTELSPRFGSTDIVEDLTLAQETGIPVTTEVVFDAELADDAGPPDAPPTRFFVRRVAAQGDGYAITFTDVTSVKNDYISLARSEMRYRSLAETTNAVIWITSPEGMFEEPQPSWSRYTGMTEEEYAGWGWIDAIHVADRPGVAKRWQKAVSTTGIYRSLQRIWSVAHQEFRHTVVRAAPIMGADRVSVEEWVGIIEDVHDRRLGEEALRQSEEKLRLAMGAAELGTWRIDFETGQATCGPRLNVILGFDATERVIPLDEYRTYIFSGDRESFQAALETTTATGAPFEAHYRVVRPDGGIRWIRDHGRLMTGINGQQILTGAVLDVTETKVAEEALRETTRRLEVALQSRAVFLFHQDLDLRYTWMHGHHPDLNAKRICGRSDEDILPPAEARSLREIKRAVLRSGKGARTELMIPTSQGVQAFDLTIEPVRDGSEPVRGLTIAAVEITDRKRAEDAVRQREEEMRGMTNAIPIFVSVVDRELRYEFVNDAYESFFGKPRATFIGRKVEDVIRSTPNTGKNIAHMHRALGGEAQQFELTILGRHGEPTHFQVHYTPRKNPSGEVDGIYVVASDITSLKNAEMAQADSERQLRDLNRTLEQRVEERTAESRRRAVQLRALNQLLSSAELKERQRIAAWLHDDLQQNLTAAVMRIDRMVEQLGETPPHEPRLHAVASEVAGLLRRSIADVRSLSVELTPPILQHGTLAQSISWLAEQNRKKYGLDVSVDLETDFDPTDEPTRIALFEATREFLFNVTKHSGQSAATVAFVLRNDGVAVSVQDRGAGCDPARLESVLQDATTIGIPGLREKLEAMGGSLRVESPPDGGFVAEIWLPAEPRAEHSPGDSDRLCPAPAIPPPRAHPPYRVAIADDSNDVRAFLVKIIAECSDLKVIGEAASGNAIIDATPRLLPDVIVMDVNMPEVNGIEATRTIHATHPQIVIVAVSVNDDAETRAAMLAAGARAYVEKSAAAESLCAVITGCFSDFKP